MTGYYQASLAKTTLLWMDFSGLSTIGFDMSTTVAFCDLTWRDKTLHPNIFDKVVLNVHD